MATEKLTAQIIVETDQKSLKQSEQEIERLRSPEAIKMAVDLWQLRQQLNVVKKALAESLKVWDSDLAKKLWGDLEILKKQITQANRELTNFVRTGDKEVSVLWKLFQQVWIDINSGFWKVLSAITGSFAQWAANAFNTVWLWATSLWQKLQGLSQNAQESGNTISAAFWKWALLAGIAAVGAAVFKLGQEALLLWDKYEQSSLSFTVMLWSGEKAKELLSDLSLFASKTPFEIQGIRDSAKQLLAFGVSSNSLIGTLKILWDAAAATGTPLDQIAYAYGQVRTANQLYWTELRQFMNAGIPILSELAKMYGVTEQAARKMVEDGKISFNDVQEAFKRMASEWGRFANMMWVQAETLTGKWSNLKDKFTMFIEQMGTAMIPFAKLVVDAGSWLFEQFSNSFKGMQMITTIVTAYIIDRWYYVADVFNGVVIFLKKFWVIWMASFKQLWDNVFTLIENVGIAFDNMPAYIQWGLNKALETINGFVNSAWDMLNGVAEFFWKTWGLVWKVDFKLDFAWPKKDFKEFSTAIADAWVEQALALDVQRTQYKAHTAEMQDLNKAALKEYLNDATSQVGAAKQLNYDLEKVAWSAQKEDEKSKKKWADLAKKAEAERKKIYEDSIKFQKKVFEEAVKLRENDLKATEEYIWKLKDALKEIADIEKEIANVGKDADQKSLEAAGDRYRQLLEWKKKAEEDLKKEMQSTDLSLYAIDPAFQKKIDEYTNQIKELENSGLLDQNTKAKEQQRASLSSEWQDRFDFQDKLWQIAIDKANKQAELQAKKTEIEEKLWLSKYQAEQELLVQEKRKSANEIALTKYKDMIALVEKGITDNTQKEIDRRMSLYAQEEQRLLRLIELRMQAWYAVGAISAQPQANTTNNTTNVTMNAQIANSVDIDQVAQSLARKIQLSSKWVS